MKSTILPVLKSPGSQFRAAPGIPDDIRATASLLNMRFNWIKGRNVYFAVVNAGPTEHVFEADPAKLGSVEEWMDFLKLVADFMKDKSYDTVKFEMKLAEQRDLYTARYLEKSNEQTEQDPTAGSADTGRPEQQRRTSTPRGSVSGYPAGADSPPSANAFAGVAGQEAD